jgi:hypothetical protein
LETNIPLLLITIAAIKRRNGCRYLLWVKTIILPPLGVVVDVFRDTVVIVFVTNDVIME